MAKSKYYAVKVGRKPGIYTSWDDAKKQVYEYTNAVYKSFGDKQDAINYLNGEKSSFENDSNYVIAYTDGSFREEDNSYSYGAVIYFDDSIIKMNQRFINEFSDQRNVAGEVYGAAKVIEFAYNNKIEKIQIHHDYKGVGAWPTKEWEAKSDIAKKYLDFYNKAKTKVEVDFVWVKGHSGDFNNDLVDQLAKDAEFEFNERRESK